VRARLSCSGAPTAPLPRIRTLKPSRPELGARLDHLCLQSPDPERLARFFERGFGMAASQTGARWQCKAPERHVLIEAGAPNKTAFFAYSFASGEDLGTFKVSLAKRGVKAIANPSPLFDANAFAVADPDGNRVVFGTQRGGMGTEPLPARLQHIVFRSPNIDQMVAFYSESLGFTVSDRVKDEGGVLRACFMRTDLEHHALAVFRAPEARLDHHSYETGDWNDIRRWADHLAERRIPIFWGVGRHGPGDDLFFMVKDPDDNLVEISAEMEQCAIDRKEGLWPHEQRTLNVWGQAIMRS
jgi:catechol 2,3-dioxygenase